MVSAARIDMITNLERTQEDVEIDKSIPIANLRIYSILHLKSHPDASILFSLIKFMSNMTNSELKFSGKSKSTIVN